MNIFVIVFVVAIVLISGSLFWRNNYKKEEGFTKEAAGFIVAISAFVITAITLILPQEKVSVLFPEYENKISEIENLKKENRELKSAVASEVQEKNNLTKQNKDLAQKNYADINKVSLVVDGLLKEDGNTAIASVNNSLYYNEDVLKNIINQELNYNEDTKTVFIGSKSNQKITKHALSEQYSILYGGENYESLDETDEDYHVGGALIKDGFVLNSSSYMSTTALLNVDNQFTKVGFDIGKIDESTYSLEDGKLKIELNGEKKYQEDIRADITSHHFEYDITDAKTLKFEMADSDSSFGIYNIVFTK
ncbi:hypothetical protein HCJ39_14970 [Listeria rocourtiae]|uniref:hypothetical protein n=1 Tax=Listeria rocourtiae TaxID=647910 RepID=UPI001627946A|nr:hypothetical protein [Listeria rocourtiae]MBC1606018.1 hypothetical protein [Listeria rocourtiae]